MLLDHDDSRCCGYAAAAAPSRYRCRNRPRSRATVADPAGSVVIELVLTFCDSERITSLMLLRHPARRSPMKIGYARTSTFDQIAGLDAQRRDLEAAGCTRDRSRSAASLIGRSSTPRSITCAMTTCSSRPRSTGLPAQSQTFCGSSRQPRLGVPGSRSSTSATSIPAASMVS
jgi:hypothetical protein